MKFVHAFVTTLIVLAVLVVGGATVLAVFF